MTTPQTPDLAAIKGRQQKAWSSGDYGKVGVTLMMMGELLAEAEGLEITFEVSDAEDLPYPDASFDVVLSTLGVMFAPDQEKAASELLRVVRPGGTIAMASWVPDGYIGDLFKTIGKHVPPPAGLRPPFRWGTEEGLDELLDGGIGSLQTRRRTMVWRFPSARHHVEFMREYYGPLNKAFGTLDEVGQNGLEQDLISLAERYNHSENGTAILHCDYLEVVATRR